MSAIPFAEILVWSLTVVLTLVGLVGIIVPVLPGTTLILIGMVLHKVFLPEDLTWGYLAWVTVFWFLSVVADLVGVLVGTKLFGGSRWGMAGAGGGALIGTFISLPAMLLGTILGAMVAEKAFARKSHRDTLRAGAGAATGFVLSTVARAACAAGMITAFILGLLADRA